MARKTYTREFKLQAIRMMTDQGLSVCEVDISAAGTSKRVKSLCSFQHREDLVFGMAWSPDSKHLVSTASEGPLTRWTLPTTIKLK